MEVEGPPLIVSSFTFSLKIAVKGTFISLNRQVLIKMRCSYCFSAELIVITLAKCLCKILNKRCLRMYFSTNFTIGSKAVVQRCSVKHEFFKIWQNSQESTCARVSLFYYSCRPEAFQLYWKSDSEAGVFLWVLQNF